MIEEARPDDRIAVIALWRACGLTRPWNDPDADFYRAIEWPGSAVLVLREGDGIAASVMVGFDGHRGWVYYLAAAPDHRRRGLGRQMMAAAEDWLRGRGAPKIQLMVRTDNDEALGFYDALGLTRQDVVTLGRFLDEGP
jgi:ribosomal protein S18 acetylase RimI-like enzyme